MVKKILSIACAAICAGLLGSCDRELQTIKERGRLIVAIGPDLPGIVELGDNRYGYPRDLMEEYARSLGMELELIYPGQDSSRREVFRYQRADMALAFSSSLGLDDLSSTEAYTVSYVALADRQLAARRFPTDSVRLEEGLRGSRILVSDGFALTPDYVALLGSLRNTGLFISHQRGEELFSALRRGECDFLICEKSEALIACTMLRNVDQVWEFPAATSISVVGNPAEPYIVDNFAQWLGRFRASSDYAMLNSTYFDSGVVGRFIVDAAGHKHISRFDPLFKQAALSEGHDWRLLAAIAHSESHFHPFAISPRGACGLMQVMPATASRYNVDEREIMKPEVNIMVAARVLSDIRRSLRFTSSTPAADRLSFILACYNGGLHRILAARSAIADAGGNPNSWSEASEWLLRQRLEAAADEEVVLEEEEVATPRCDKGETLLYFDKVLSKYNYYCRNVEL
jgi:membrane-bound lytic murein transglycosylase MltF